MLRPLGRRRRRQSRGWPGPGCASRSGREAAGRARRCGAVPAGAGLPRPALRSAAAASSLELPQLPVVVEIRDISLAAAAQTNPFRPL